MSEPVKESRPQASPDATVTGLIASHELRSGDVLAGRFRVEGVLGIGGMGVVFRAYDQSLGIEVAIKLLRPEFARRPEAFERFKQELLLARQVSSPHVVRIHDIAQHEGRWFISMDFIDGESLERRLEQSGRPTLEQVIAWTRALLAGLAAAHHGGVVHRDLKPANILLDRGDQALITDFGVARSLGASGSMTQSGIIIGTPEYLSPEQARGETVDARSDLYAVGLILYEMLSGSLPFAGGTPAETVMQRLVRAPPSLARHRPDLPRWMHAFSDRLLRLKPAQRFASADEALRALEQRRVPRAPLNRRALLLSVLALSALLAAGDWLRRESTLRSSPAIVMALPDRIPHIAIVPFSTVSGDDELAALARAIEEHASAWLRNDAAVAVVSRHRTLAALARAAPGARDDALLRRLADVAQASNAARLLYARLFRDEQGLHLALQSFDPDPAAATLRMRVDGRDAATLFANYVSAAGPVFGKLVAAGSAPPLAGRDSVALGQALLALDQKQPDAALAALGTNPDESSSALWEHARLEAQEAARQELPAQSSRDAVLRNLGDDSSALGLELRARALRGNGDLAQAANLLATAGKHFPHDPALALLGAEVLAANGDGKLAQDRLERYVAVDDQDARAWFLLGRSTIEQGQAQRAVDDYLVRALVLATRAGDARGQADAHNALGIGYERLGQLDAAIEQYTRAVSMRTLIGERRDQATSLRNLAIVQAIRGDRAGAESNLDRARVELERLGDRASLADLHNDRGVVAEEHGDFSDALAAYRDALALRQQLGVPAPIAQSLNNVGFCYFQLGEIDNAAVYWQQALTQYETIDDQTGALHVSQSMGLLDIARGHYAAAAKRLRTSVTRAEDLQLPEESAVGHVYLAELALAEGRYADALGEVELARAGFARRADQRGLAEAALLHARTRLALGDAAAAMRVLDDLPSTSLNPEQQAMHAFARSLQLELQGELAAANRALEESAQAAATAHSGTLALEVRILRAQRAILARERRRYAPLLTSLQQESAQRGQAPLRLRTLRLRMMEAQQHGGSKQAAIDAYREAVRLLKDMPRWYDAFVLHALGAKLLGSAAAGEATAAQAAAATTRAQLIASAPEPARALLEKEILRRLRQDSGDEHLQ